jgi:hypothetical protein
MSFPKIEHPTYTVDLSIGQVTYRPFLVKEQKILMMAHNTQNIDAVVDALKVIVHNCIVAPANLDIAAMPLSDLTHLFLHLRARSMGEKMKVYFKCTNEFEGKPCGMVLEDEVDLLEVKPEGGGGNPVIMITKDIGVHMHYPSFDLLNLIMKNQSSIEAEFIVMAGCIDYVFDANGRHNVADASVEEVQKFVTDLPEDKYNLLKSFVSNAPTIKKTIRKNCVKCNYAHEMVLEGLSDFFV